MSIDIDSGIASSAYPQLGKKCHIIKLKTSHTPGTHLSIYDGEAVLGGGGKFIGRVNSEHCEDLAESLREFFVTSSSPKPKFINGVIVDVGRGTFNAVFTQTKEASS